MQVISKILMYFTIVVILLAFLNMPYSYYHWLRIFVFITAITVMIADFKNANPLWLVVFGFIAIIFNPIYPVHLYSKENWLILDIVCVFLFAVKIYIYSSSSRFKTFLK